MLKILCEADEIFKRDSDSEEMSKVKKPSEKVFKKWRRHEIDVEPSAKMVAMVNYIKEWDAMPTYGNPKDKTIIYSQCKHISFAVNFLLSN